MLWLYQAAAGLCVMAQAYGHLTHAECARISHWYTLASAASKPSLLGAPAPVGHCFLLLTCPIPSQLELPALPVHLSLLAQ